MSYYVDEVNSCNYTIGKSLIW